jgi:DNA invertase Pin-like site-specific DNA recombinase
MLFIQKYLRREWQKSRCGIAAALANARRQRCSVAVSKLDRLSRDAHFISGLMAHGVPFRVVDLGPDVDPTILDLFAALAEKERVMIGDPRSTWIKKTRRGSNAAGSNAIGIIGGRYIGFSCLLGHAAAPSALCWLK